MLNCSNQSKQSTNLKYLWKKLCGFIPISVYTYSAYYNIHIYNRLLYVVSDSKSCKQMALFSILFHYFGLLVFATRRDMCITNTRTCTHKHNSAGNALHNLVFLFIKFITICVVYVFIVAVTEIYIC